MTKSDLVEISCELVKETDDAVYVNDGAKKVWLPKSQIEVEEAANGEEIVVTLPEWLAINKGLV